MRRYRPQMDSVRALAVIGVLYCHSTDENALLGAVAGAWGVHIFFVLSGYLITGILLEARACRTEGRSAPLWRFYVRRALRLWPAYYAVLAAAVLLHAPDVEQTLPWHVLYATNLLLFLKDDWYPWITGHFWTLDVEEQFYLVWPLIVLFVGRRGLALAMLSCVFGAVAFRLLAGRLGWDGQNITVEMFFPANMTMLGGGGLLAVLDREGSPLLRRLPVLGWAAAAVLAVGIALGQVWSDWLLPVEALLWSALVHRSATGFGGVLGRVLDWAPLRHGGRVSYGVYLVHPFVIWKLTDWRHGALVPHVGLRLFALTSLVSFTVASASWYIYERRVNRLKHFFPYP